MEGRKVIIIGSGLGGLVCGVLLSRRGFDVTVLEQHSRVGGCLQSFTRSGLEFNTGLHFVGAFGPGEELRNLWEPLGLLDLPWERLDGQEVVVGHDSFFLPAGYEAYEEALISCFPNSADEIRAFASGLRSVVAHPQWMERGAKDWVEETVSDPLLRKVVCGTSLTMELGEALPLYTFARINDSFIRGAWRLGCGGSAIAETLAREILLSGGRVLTGMEATGVGQDCVVTSQRTFPADMVISDIAPAALVAIAPGLRRVYRERIAALPQTSGFTTVQIALKEDIDERRSIFIHSEDADLWRPSRQGSPESVAVSFGPRTVDLMSRTGGVDEIIGFAQERLSGLGGQIDRITRSTPDTWERYTSTPGGSAYGLVRDWRDPLRTMLSVRTPQPNLFLTGQHIGLHGLMGVTESAYRTVEEILKR